MERERDYQNPTWKEQADRFGQQFELTEKDDRRYFHYFHFYFHFYCCSYFRNDIGIGDNIHHRMDIDI